MIVGLAYDHKDDVYVTPGGPEDALEEYDNSETIAALENALKTGGHQVVRLGGGRAFLENILKQNVDFVFNISEGLGQHRSREAQVPSVLEMLNIPYSGADPQCLSICLDKHMTKLIVSNALVPTPGWQIIDNSSYPSIDWNSLEYPAIIKPVWEGSSKGIGLSSLVKNPEQACQAVTRALELYQQPVMVEGYITGDEVTVAMIGNDPTRVLGVMRILPRDYSPDFVYSIEVKRNYINLVEYECPAKLEPQTLQLIQELSHKVYAILGCRDFARMDYRVTPDGRPFFLEINPLAGLNPQSSDIVIMAGLLGIPYNELVNAIFNSALKRYPQCLYT